MLSGKRLLIVEEEFLIALDIQRMLDGAGTTAMIFVRSVDEAEAHVDRLENMDIAIIGLPMETSSAITLAQALHERGIAVVVSSSDHRHRHGIPALPFAAIIIKPFADEDLTRACLKALGG
ncbi:MAG TPA: response regulator [Devosiaceae bacterium]|jgi:two-component SAPR family response regulator